MAGVSRTFGNVNNAGTIFTHGVGPGTTLTVANYVGASGNVVFNTFLGADNSPSDRLVVNGGTATGTTTLTIYNTTRPGEPTTANGILVVNAINGATTAPGAFALAPGELRAGVFDYRLFQGGITGSDPNNWFLRSTFLVPPATPSAAPLYIYQQLSIISFLFHLLYQRLRFAQLPSIPLWTPSGKPHAGRRACLTARCISWPNLGCLTGVRRPDRVVAHPAGT